MIKNEETGWTLLEPADIERLKARSDLPSTIDDLLKTFPAVLGLNAPSCGHAVGFEMKLSRDDFVLPCCEVLCRAMAEALEGKHIVVWRHKPKIVMERPFEIKDEFLRISARFAT